MLYNGRAASEREEWRVERGETALDFMNEHLSSRQYWCDTGFSVADISLLAYTRVAHEGGFDLARREHVERWIDSVEGELKLK